MTKRFLFVALALSSLAHAQSQVLFTVDDTPVMADEFAYVYNKNKDIGRDIDPKTPREYLELYINFKLKVHEAEERGMDTLPRFINEFESYRTQLAKPYLTVKEVNEQILQEAYNNMLWDIRASHIMLDLDPNALPEDTARVYNQLMGLREQILNGDRTFDEVARSISTDTYSAREGGDLGWFTAFNMVYPFEHAAYTQEEGEISKPVRTQYGYHLIKTTGRRYARGKIEVAHILAYAPQDASAEERESAERKIQEIYESLEGGAEFAQLARQYSDDKSTANMGGVLPVFGMKEMLPEFEEAAFALENDGDITAPFETKIGFHIVKRLNRPQMSTFEYMRDELLQKIQRDSRANLGREVFVNKLKREYEWTIEEEALMEVVHTIDASFNEGEWDGSQFADSDEAVFTFGDVVLTQAGVYEHLNRVQQRPRQSADPQARAFGLVMTWAEGELINLEDRSLADKYPDFRYLVNEYREGILLFDLTQDEVWNKAAQDSAGLYEFYTNHVEKYSVGPRYQAVRITAASKELAKDVEDDLEDGMSGAQILEKYNVDSELAVKVDTLTLTFDSNSTLHDEAEGETGVYGVWERDDRWDVFEVISIVPEGPRPLNEIRGLVTSDYQKQIEEEWVAELREKYEVEVNDEVMKELEADL